MAKFIGGSEDGKSRFVAAGARVYLVTLRDPQQTATVADFNVINLDEVWNGRAVPKLQVQRYRRAGYDHENDVVTYEFDGMEEQ